MKELLSLFPALNCKNSTIKIKSGVVIKKLTND